MNKKKHSISSDEEVHNELEPQIRLHSDDHRFQMKVYETVELLQEVCPFSQAESTIRRLVAQYGEAYFFFNKTGNLCFLTDFVKPAK